MVSKYLGHIYTLLQRKKTYKFGYKKFISELLKCNVGHTKQTIHVNAICYFDKKKLIKFFIKRHRSYKSNIGYVVSKVATMQKYPKPHIFEFSEAAEAKR